MNLGLIPAREPNGLDRFEQDVIDARNWANKAQKRRSNMSTMQKSLLKKRAQIQKLPNPFHVLN